MRLILPLRARTLAAAFTTAYLMTGLLACITGATGPTATFQGIVADDLTGTPINQASVGLAQTSTSVNTDASGKFTLQVPVSSQPYALVANANGYVHIVRWLAPNSTGWQNVTLSMRAIGSSQTVNLPATAGIPATVTFSGATSSVTLTIPANALQGLDGTAASGAAQVNITRWDPIIGVTSSPGLLLEKSAANPNTPTQLIPLAMASLAVLQGNTVLQVAPNATVKLEFDVGASVSAAITSSTWQKYAGQPNFYALDANTGLWNALVNNSKLTLNGNTFVGNVTTLNDWTLAVDGANPTNGGCIQGKLVDPCGAPLVHRSARALLTDSQGTNNYLISSDANGNWCRTVGIADAAWPASAPTLHYYVGDMNNLANSSLCDYVPTRAQATCQTYPFDGSTCAWYYLDNLYNRGWFVANNIYGSCSVYDPSTCPDAPACTAPQTYPPQYAATFDASTGGTAQGGGTCNVPTVCPQSCHFCGNGDVPASGTCNEQNADGSAKAAVIGACADVGSITLVVDPNAQCVCANPNNPHFRGVGESCTNVGDQCCAASTQCVDGACVRSN